MSHVGENISSDSLGDTCSNINFLNRHTSLNSISSNYSSSVDLARSIDSGTSRHTVNSRCSSSDGNTTIGDDRSSSTISSALPATSFFSAGSPFTYLHDEISLRSPLPQKYGTLRCSVVRAGNDVHMQIEKKNQGYILHNDKCSDLMTAKKISSFLSSGFEIYKNESGAGCFSKLAQVTCGFGRALFEISYCGNAVIGRSSSGDLSDAENGCGGVISSSDTAAPSSSSSKRSVLPGNISYKRPKGDRAISGPRLMDVDVPIAEIIDAQSEAWRCKLVNKPAEWNPHRKCYVLPFHGRANIASVKNFQLVCPEDSSNVILLFGRSGQDKFSLDFQWPLSPLQAFAIALSSFEAFR